MDWEINLGASSSDQIKRIQLKEIINDEHFLYRMYGSTQCVVVQHGIIIIIFSIERLFEKSKRKE